ncbi:MAG: TolC family protein [Bacteroidota bacterium]
MKIQLLLFFLFLGGIATAQQRFDSLESLFEFADQQSTDLIISRIRETQAQKSETATKWEIINPTVSLPANFTYNTTLPVSVLPAEAFGGDPGENLEIRTGVPYTTNFSQNIDLQLVNPGGWSAYRLARINEQLSTSNTQLQRQILQESIAEVYFNILTLEKQRESTNENLAISDSIFQLTEDKYQAGIVNQQSVNNARLTQLNNQQSLQQIRYLVEDAYITLKTLINLSPQEKIIVSNSAKKETAIQHERAQLNHATIENKLLQQQYTLQNYKRSKAYLYPTVSLYGGNSFQLNNQEFSVLNGDWITSNYVGVQLSINLPNASSLNNLQQSKLDHKIASLELEAERQDAALEAERLNTNFAKAVDELELYDEMLQINEDTYEKNFNLYQEGLLPLDTLLDSYNNLIGAKYNFNAALIGIDLAVAKIHINNTKY